MEIKNKDAANEGSKEKGFSIDEKRLIEQNIVFIGTKPLINYVKSIMMQFNKNNVREVIIKSRGKFISKAVDAAEISKRMLEKQAVKIKGISIASESFEKEGKKTNVSTMDIILSI